MRTGLLSPIELTESKDTKPPSTLDFSPFQHLVDTQQNWPHIKQQIEAIFSEQRSNYLRNIQSKIARDVNEEIIYKFKAIDPGLNFDYTAQKKERKETLQRQEAKNLLKSFANLNTKTFYDLPQLQTALYTLANDLIYYSLKRGATEKQNLLNKCHELLRNNPVSENKNSEKRYKENWLIFYKYKIIFNLTILISFQHRSQWTCGLFCSNQTTLGSHLQRFINSPAGGIIKDKFFKRQSSLSYDTIGKTVLPIEYSGRASTFFSASFMAENFNQIGIQLSALEGNKPLTFSGPRFSGHI